MSRFEQRLAARAMPRLLEHAGESVIFTPVGGGGTPRTVTAIVTRYPVGGSYSAEGGFAVKMELELLNDGTLGMTPAQAQEQAGRGTFTLAYPAGAAAQDYRMRLPQDGQPWHDGASVRVWLE